MRFLRSLLFAALAVVPVTFVSCNHDVNIVPLFPLLPTAAEIFKDPNGGFVNNGIAAAQLDLNVKSFCPKRLVVQVHLPKTYADVPVGTTGKATNAIFDSDAVGNFATIPIAGFTQHSSGAQTTATLDVSWDALNKVLTFSGFNKAAAGVAALLTDPVRGWVNIHFDIQPEDFVDPATATPGLLPLKMVLLSGAPATNDLVINHNYADFFHVFEVPELDPDCRGGNTPGGSGDPVFSGFQGQQYQFHGLPDEHFNLISSPDVQLNSHFVYLSSGKCDYNDTECFTHPGTYMDVLGLSVAESRVKMVAGTHEQGLRIWVNDMEIKRGAHIKALSSNVTSALRYHHNGRVEIHTDLLNLEVANSDMFMNIRAALNDHQLLRVGAAPHTVTDHKICKTNSETNNHQLIEQTVSKKYPVNTPLHGLIGQTWRNVKVCARDWMGTVQDYLVSDLFASDAHYSYFKW